VLFVGDVDLGEEGFFLGGALEADAVRALVVDVAVLRVGGLGELGSRELRDES